MQFCASNYNENVVYPKPYYGLCAKHQHVVMWYFLRRFVCRPSGLYNLPFERGHCEYSGARTVCSLAELQVATASVMRCDATILFSVHVQIQRVRRHAAN
jgi:hypothetical protein